MKPTIDGLQNNLECELEDAIYQGLDPDDVRKALSKAGLQIENYWLDYLDDLDRE